ncbi:MAG: hypothetical protein AAFN77_08680 [Planctomycetota bacterium]
MLLQMIQNSAKDLFRKSVEYIDACLFGNPGRPSSHETFVIAGVATMLLLALNLYFFNA